VDRAATRALARKARRFIVKAGETTLRFDQATNPITEEQVQSYLIHEDGFLRVPVLMLGDLLVRGYTEAIYREALTPVAGSAAGPVVVRSDSLEEH
jgi:arsenate reductase-like glutaredoxin family protein